MQEFFRSFTRTTLINYSLITAFLFTVIFMIVMQFMVESLHERIAKTELQIAAYEDEITLLDVEWVYLTRPERLRNLSSIYLKESNYAVANQIKDPKGFAQFHLVNYGEPTNIEIASDNNNATISF